MDLRGGTEAARIELCGNALHHANILKKWWELLVTIQILAVFSGT
jgi:hypothetical protein